MKQLDNRSIETNGEIIKFDIAIRQIVEYKDFFVILLREKEGQCPASDSRNK